MADGPSLREITDRFEIEDLLVAYAEAVDARDWGALKSLFADDAVLDYSAFGGPRGSLGEALSWLEESLAKVAVTQHLISNTRIEIDGDTATARCEVFNPLGVEEEGGLRVFFVGGSYRDRLVRTPGGWRIAERVAHMSWMRGGRRG